MSPCVPWLSDEVAECQTWCAERIASDPCASCACAACPSCSVVSSAPRAGGSAVADDPDEQLVPPPWAPYPSPLPPPSPPSPPPPTPPPPPPPPPASCTLEVTWEWAPSGPAATTRRIVGIVRLKRWRPGATLWLDFGSPSVELSSSANAAHATALPAAPLPGLLGFTLHGVAGRDAVDREAEAAGSSSGGGWFSFEAEVVGGIDAAARSVLEAPIVTCPMFMPRPPPSPAPPPPPRPPPPPPSPSPFPPPRPPPPPPPLPPLPPLPPAPPPPAVPPTLLATAWRFVERPFHAYPPPPSPPSSPQPPLSMDALAATAADTIVTATARAAAQSPPPPQQQPPPAWVLPVVGGAAALLSLLLTLPLLVRAARQHLKLSGGYQRVALPLCQTAATSAGGYDSDDEAIVAAKDALFTFRQEIKEHRRRLR